MSQRKRSRTSSVDHYLAEEIIPRAPDFDILLWWKLNGAKYPTLQRIARDFLAIPITSVASESAFSSCARLLDSHRSKLHYKTVEAMLCARSWVKDETSREPDTTIGELEGVFSALDVHDTDEMDHDNRGKTLNSLFLDVHVAVIILT
ncbi:Zinc finger BED domain-containing protein RICESLEEPER 3 [Linum perenne]